MPTWNEFIAGFGLKELILTILVIAIIIIAREKDSIFRRKSK
jgi:hypothetical protein